VKFVALLEIFITKRKDKEDKEDEQAPKKFVRK
jgi:hypothetical protein